MLPSNTDIVRSYYLSIDHSELEKAALFLSDDFRKLRPGANSLSKPEALRVVRSLKTAMPDLKYILSSMETEGQLVRVTVQAGGRHLNALQLSDLEMGIPSAIVPGSGRMIIFLPNRFEYCISNGQIVSEKDITPPTQFNGVTGFLHAIGYAG
jgi:hypothetical protein